MKLTRRTQRNLFASAGGLSLIAALAMLIAAAQGGLGLTPATAANDVGNLTPAQQESIEHANTLSHAFRAASERVLPAVVTIQNLPADVKPIAGDSSGNLGSPDGIPDEMRNNPLFRRFFRDMPQSPRQRPQPRSQGMGSGVIIDPDGIILTNNHVVDGGGKIIVRLHDGREFEATDVKTDPKTDIAVVRIEGAGTLPSAVIGNSDGVEIGDWVLAVGAPFGLKESVTAGIISAKSRGIGITDREEFLQTDAAINPGNSGGPLVNLKGEVIGINTAISSTTGGYQGIGFAVPVNLAKWVTGELVAHGTVQRAFLGIGIQPMTDSLSKQLGLSTVNGVLVTEVRPDSAAAKSGLQSGDVIVEFDGKAIHHPRELQSAVERAAIDQSHAVTIVRNGKRRVVDVNVAQMPQTLAVTQQDQSVEKRSAANELGLEVTNLSRDVAEQLGMQSTEGVLVTDVTPGSPAARAGIAASTVILKIGKATLTNVDDFQQAVEGLNIKDGVLMLVRSTAGSRFVVVRD